jgi:hypothetical protein
VTDNLPTPLADTLPARPAAANRRTGQPSCHRCTADATHSWRRAATDAEREGYWAALEANIRAQPNLSDASNAEYVADHTAPVTKAVFGCGDHDLSPAPADDSDDAAAAAKQAGLDARILTHSADCGGHGECQCGGAA